MYVFFSVVFLLLFQDVFNIFYTCWQPAGNLHLLLHFLTFHYNHVVVRQRVRCSHIWTNVTLTVIYFKAKHCHNNTSLLFAFVFCNYYFILKKQNFTLVVRSTLLFQHLKGVGVQYLDVLMGHYFGECCL